MRDALVAIGVIFALYGAMEVYRAASGSGSWEDGFQAFGVAVLMLVLFLWTRRFD